MHYLYIKLYFIKLKFIQTPNRYTTDFKSNYLKLFKRHVNLLTQKFETYCHLAV